jgi:hypothetical protein
LKKCRLLKNRIDDTAASTSTLTYFGLRTIAYILWPRKITILRTEIVTEENVIKLSGEKEKVSRLIVHVLEGENSARRNQDKA